MAYVQQPQVSAYAQSDYGKMAGEQFFKHGNHHQYPGGPMALSLSFHFYGTRSLGTVSVDVTSAFFHVPVEGQLAPRGHYSARWPKIS